MRRPETQGDNRNGPIRGKAGRSAGSIVSDRRLPSRYLQGRWAGPLALRHMPRHLHRTRTRQQLPERRVAGIMIALVVSATQSAKSCLLTRPRIRCRSSSRCHRPQLGSLFRHQLAHSGKIMSPCPRNGRVSTSGPSRGLWRQPVAANPRTRVPAADQDAPRRKESLKAYG